MSEQPQTPGPSLRPEQPSEPATAASILGTNKLQGDVDSLTGSVGKLTASTNSFVQQIGALLGRVSGLTSSGVAANASSSAATGGGYAARAPSGGPMRTMGAVANGFAASLGSKVGTWLGNTYGSGTGTATGAGGAGAGAAGAAATGGGAGKGSTVAGLMVSGSFKALAGYAQSRVPTILTMDRVATNGVNNSGVGPGGYAATAQRMVSMVYGGHNQNLNVTAASPQDAAGAAALLNYYSGQTMTTGAGGVNQSWFSAQSGMYSMGYANPYMSQTQIAQNLASVYSNRSLMTMWGLGYQPSVGAGGQLASPQSIAQNVFARTFGGKTSVSAATMAAATGERGSLNANLGYLAQQAGWSQGTVTMLETYLQQRNNAINQGANPNTLDNLIQQASRGDKSAQSQLSKYGIGASTVQGIKNLQASQTGTTADQYGSFNSSLQQSVSLLTDFNQALDSLLTTTPLGSMLGTAGGMAAGFPGLTNAFGGAAGGFTSGLVGGAGGMGSLGSAGMGLATNLAGTAVSGVAFRQGGKFASGMWARVRGRGGSASSGAADDAASSAADDAAGDVAAGAADAGGAGLMSSLGVAGLGLGAAYVGSHVSQGVSTAVAQPGSTSQELLRTGGYAASYALAGAAIGSVVPGLGTALGAGIGGTIGVFQGLYDWYKDRESLSSNPNTANSGSVMPSAPPGASTNGSPAPIVNGPTQIVVGQGSGAAPTSPLAGLTGLPNVGMAAPPSSVTPAVGATAAGGGAVSKAIAFGLAQVGKPYQWGGTGPNAYDCSGLTQACYKAGGVSIPRTSQQQMTIGSPVKPGTEQAGDLMFPEPGHVVMCLGGGKCLEAPHTGTNVRSRTYQTSEFPTMRRVVSSAGQNAGASGGNGATNTTSSGPTGSNASESALGGLSELQAFTNAMNNAFLAPLPTNNTGSLAPLPGSINGSSNTANSTTNTDGLNPQNMNGKVSDQYGHTYQIPSGPKPAGTLSNWISTALSILGLPAGDSTDVNIIASHESGGNPWAINLSDSNAAAGHPSEGIMQTIPSTFSGHALPGHTNIWNPVDNIIAGARYATSRYGSLDKVPGVVAVKANRPYVGYSVGSYNVPQTGTAQLHAGEMVVEAPLANTIRNSLLKESLYSPGAAGAQSAGGQVALNFAPGSITVSIPNASPQAAQQAAQMIVDTITSDPRIAQMAVGL